MKLREIVQVVEGTIMTRGANLDLEISCGGAADLMSDVLALMTAGSLLLTGLITLQAIRTAEIADLAAIVFVRGKTPGPQEIALAEELGVPLITSSRTMFELCGRLYRAGMASVEI